MSTKFLLDVSVLDDRFANSPLCVGINAEQLSIIDGNPRKYHFFQEKVSLDQILFVNKTLDLAPSQEFMFGGFPKFLYKKAALYFYMDLGINPDRRAEKKVKEQKLSMYDAWYADGKFMKGDAKQFEEYGILIK